MPALVALLAWNGPVAIALVEIEANRFARDAVKGTLGNRNDLAVEGDGSSMAFVATFAAFAAFAAAFVGLGGPFALQVGDLCFELLDVSCLLVVLLAWLRMR